MKATELVVYYNAACPICSREIAHYRKLAENEGVPLVWRDAAAGADELIACGVPPAAAVERLHAIDGTGRLLSGVDAFLAIWSLLPRWRILGRVVGWRPVRALMGAAYERGAAPLLAALHRRRMRS